MRYFLFRMKRFCGFAMGFVFFISGVLKLMDPVGTGLVMKEYFQFLHIGFLEFIAKPAGSTFAMAETIVGAGLITGVWRRAVAAAALILQGFFTLLTLLLVIFNPEMDCGCFGEAVHLTHGQTFAKNIVILILLIIYYIPARYLGGTKPKKYVSFGLVTASVIAFFIYSWLYIPMTDFTAFRPGNVVNNATEDHVYESAFIYEKDGLEQTFTLEDLPDSTWSFVRTETVLKSGTEKTQANMSVYDSEGAYADSLLTKGRVMVVTVYDDDKMDDRTWNRVKRFLDEAEASGFRAMLVTAGSDMQARIHYHSDYKTIITLNRSNGGATYINNGHIIRKWAGRSLPDTKDLKVMNEEDPTDTFIGRDTSSSLAFQGFLLYVFAVMLLL